MKAEWLHTTIGEQITLQRGFDITVKDQRSGKIPVISSGGVSSYHDTAAASGPGVVIGRKGTIGTVFFIAEDYWPHDTTLWVKDYHGNEPRFVYYFLKNLDVKHLDVGSANPTLNRNHVHPISTIWPPLPEQRAIARVLGALDDKIELNRRMNAALEDLARALFKSWFVDFEPVRAKAAGRAPEGVDAATAALFPDRFETIDGREVPSGWQIGAIGDLVRVVGGSTPSTSEPRFWDDGAIHWATPKDLSNLESHLLIDTERKITDVGLDQISSGLLPTGTVLLSSRAPIGYLAVAGIPTAINQGFIAMICDKELTNYYTLLWAKEYMGDIKSRANGTTFMEVSKSNFRSLPVIRPSYDILNTFTKVVDDWYHAIANNLHQSRTLAVLRDALLPKLLSGEVRVAE